MLSCASAIRSHGIGEFGAATAITNATHHAPGKWMRELPGQLEDARG